MGSNIVNINSVNVVSLGFIAFFDLDQKNLLIDITGQTVFKTGGAANVAGIYFKIAGPGGISIVEPDFTAPNLLPSTTSTFTVALPAGFGMFGAYMIQAFIKEADAQVYQTSVITKEISRPEGYENGYVAGDISIEADCDIPQLLVTENTNNTYQAKSPVTRVVAGIFSYPAGTLANLNFTTTPFLVAGAGLVYTGRYTINNKTICTYDLNDGIMVKVPYVVKGYEKVVNNNSALAEVLCCVEDLKQTADRSPFSTQGKSAKSKLESIQVPFYIAILKEKSGQSASEELDQIKAALNCDCCSGSSAIEPRPLLGVGLTGVIINLAQKNAAIVTSAISGSTKTYTIDVKNINVNKLDADDLTFDIVKTFDANNINYTISLNHAEMAFQMLQEIENDEALNTYLKKLVAIADKGISLNGINSSCVLTITNCNYDLIEPTVPAKVILSVTIAQQTYNAPTGLLLTDVSGILTWLNGLNKGTFTVVLDNDSNTLLIKTLTNPNVINILTLTTGGQTVNRQFTRTCVGLVEILNAITTYICAIDSTRVKFGVVGKTVKSYDDDGDVITTSLNSIDTLSIVLSLMLDAQNDLYEKITQVAISCAAIKTVFQPSAESLTITDVLYGTVDGACAQVPFDKLAAMLMNRIAAVSDLKSQFCSLSSSCAPISCTVVNNVSAVFSVDSSGGSPINQILVNCNDASPSLGLQIRYRIASSSDTYVNVSCLASDLPKMIQGMATGRYEVGVRKQCTSTSFSDWQTAYTGGCAVPVAFNAVYSAVDQQFNCTATLAGSQTKIEVQVTDPSGGISVGTYTLSGGSGSFVVPLDLITNGTYSLRARGVCDATATPPYVSDYLPPVTVAIGSGSTGSTLVNSTTKPEQFQNNITMPGYSILNAGNSINLSYTSIRIKIHHDLSAVPVYTYDASGNGSLAGTYNGDAEDVFVVVPGGRVQIGGTLIIP